MSKKNSIKNIIHLSVGEEIGNSVTHGVMSLLLLGFLPWTAVDTYIRGGWVLSIGTSIFILSLFLMFLTSALYHAMAYETKHKYVLRILDHIFIYFAIAGSYTPIALYIIRGWQGTLILIIQWGMVLTGILYKSIAQKSIPKLSVTIYLIMGWIAVLFLPVILRNSQPNFLIFIALGGLLYSIGAWFYTKKERPYYHFIWHLFINFAAISHFIAIIFLI
ncbi:MAG: hemolysin III family protein [Erysipelothrix sp.]|jgi:hemolysin III|nr:hemolysin III family protein [Erysipelothrix sp.]